MKSWNWRGMRAIIWKDLKQVLSNRMVWMPMIILPILLQIVLPIGMILLPTLAGESMEGELAELEPLLKMLPPSLNPAHRETSIAAIWVILSTNYLFAPFFLIVPLMVSSILAADSLVGEKERKTLEGLLYTPLSDEEIYIAKLLTALLPALVITLASFLLYGIIVNAVGYSVVGHLFFPSRIWWPLVFWLSPAISVTGLGITVLISSRAKTFMQAQQTSGILVLPIVGWLIAQTTGLFFLDAALMLIVGLFIWIIGAWLIWIGARTFSRSRLITSI